jgi:hypothetical protein
MNHKDLGPVPSTTGESKTAWHRAQAALGDAARKVIQYAGRKVIQSEVGSFYAVPTGRQ